MKGIENGYWIESNGLCNVISKLKYYNYEWIENLIGMRLFVV